MSIHETEYLEQGDKESEGRLAFRRSLGDSRRTGLVWLGGFHSDMLGEKATALHQATEACTRSFLRFDYSGHGQSDGSFENGTVGRWRDDALAAIDGLSSGPVVLVGSSMGAWMSLLVALARPDRVAGLVLLAAAPDFTERLMWAQFSGDVRRQIEEEGSWTRPSPYDAGGYPITRDLIYEGRNWLLLDGPIAVRCPVRLLHGDQDDDVPPDHSRLLVDRLASADVRWTLIKGGDHRLSRPGDIALLIETALGMAALADATG